MTAKTTIWRVDQHAQFEKYAPEIRSAVERVLTSGRYVLGNEVSAFEDEFARYTGAARVVGVSDGTRAISMALTQLGVGPGKEVITSPFTAVPTIGAIMETGARPVFVDIDEDTWLIDIDAAAAAVNDRTAAIVPVHMFGNVVDIDALRDRLPRPLPIVEDAAQAHGSGLRGRHVGTMGDFGTFSFYPTKNLGALGDGGAISCGSAEMAERLKKMRNHGMRDKDICDTPGLNSRLDEVQAAILRAKLPHLDAMNAARAELVETYLQALPMAHFSPQKTTAGATVNNHMFQLRCLADRDALVAALDADGIQTNVYYVVPHHLQPAFADLGYQKGDFPVLESLCAQAIALPLYPEMPISHVERVADAIRRHVGGS